MSDRDTAFVPDLPERFERPAVVRVRTGVVALHAIENAEILLDPA